MIVTCLCLLSQSSNLCIGWKDCSCVTDECECATVSKVVYTQLQQDYTMLMDHKRIVCEHLSDSYRDFEKLSRRITSRKGTFTHNRDMIDKFLGRS